MFYPVSGILKRLILAITVTLWIPQFANAGPEEGLFQAAKIITETAKGQDEELRLASLKQARLILDQIVDEYPASGLAVQIILVETIDGLNIRELNEEIDLLSTRLEDQSPEITTLEPPAIVDQPTQEQSSVQNFDENVAAADQTDEEALKLDRLAIRDIQARLLVLGHDPNGVDGAIGPGTRGALSRWQETISTDPSGYLNEAQLGLLKTSSESLLQEWLQDPDNLLQHTPPPPIAIGPSNMSGNWRFRTRCGRNSRAPNTTITGSIAIAHRGGANYAGTMQNSQGFRANLGVTLNGRRIQGTANFGLFLGRVNFNARVEDQRLVMNGRDSNGCSFSAWKS